MATLTVSKHFVQAALIGPARKGFNVESMLIKAGIAPDLLKIERARVTGQQYSRLMQTIWNDMGDEHMGLGPRRCHPGTFATLCELAIDCPTLEAVYQRIMSFSQLFDPAAGMTLDIDGDNAVLSAFVEGDLYDPLHFFHESMLVIWHRLGSWLIGQPIDLNRVAFHYAQPAHSDEYRYIFRCPLTFNAPHTQLIFDRRFLSAPVIRDRAEMRQFLKTSPADLLSRPDESNTYTGKIRALIGRDLSNPLPDFEWIATELHTSPQTLRRRLRRENTSFQEIKDLLRRDQAIYYLAQPDLPINEIALRVGFTEPSTFHRAFKKWTGVTPGAYRDGDRKGDRRILMCHPRTD